MKPPTVDFHTAQRILKLGLPFFLFFSFLIGCAGPRLPIPSSESIRFADEILSKIETRERGIKDLKGIAKVKLTNLDKNYSFKQVIIVQQPSSLRMETLGFFGQPQFFLTVKDHRLSALSLTENRFYQGKVSPENLAIIFPFYLDPEDLFSILLSGVSLMNCLSTDIEFHEEENLYRVTLAHEEGHVTKFLWVEPVDLAIMKSETYDSSDNLVLRVTFDDYEIVDGTLFPMSTQILLPLSATKIKVEYSELEVNTGVSRDNFNLDVPPGVKIVNLD